MAFDGGVPGNISDLENIADGLIQRYNITGLAGAVGMYKHVTAKRIGTQDQPTAYELVISGMLALDPKGELVGPGDYKAQTRQIMDNIALAITRAARFHGLEMTIDQALSYVTDTNVMLAEMGDGMANFRAVNEAYKEGGMPAAARVAAGGYELPLAAKGVLVEIRANAVIPAPYKPTGQGHGSET